MALKRDGEIHDLPEIKGFFRRIGFPPTDLTNRGISSSRLGPNQHQALGTTKKRIFLQGGPLAVINGVIIPYKWPYKWLTALITLVIGVINPVITGSGAHLVPTSHWSVVTWPRDVEGKHLKEWCFSKVRVGEGERDLLGKDVKSPSHGSGIGLGSEGLFHQQFQNTLRLEHGVKNLDIQTLKLSFGSL